MMPVTRSLILPLLILTTWDGASSCELPIPTSGGDATDIMVESVVAQAEREGVDVVLFVVRAGHFASGIGLNSNNEHYQVRVTPRGITRGSGRNKDENAWSVALRGLESLSGDEDFQRFSPANQLTCIYSIAGETSEFHLSFETLPDCVKSILELLPTARTVGRPVRHIRPIGSHRIEGITGIPMFVVGDDSSIDVIHSDGSIAEYEITSNMFEKQRSLQSQFKRDLRHGILHAQLNQSEILILWAERHLRDFRVIVESVALDGSENVIHALTPDDLSLAWSDADGTGKLVTVDQSGRAYQFALGIKETGQRVSNIPETVRRCILSGDGRKAVVHDSDENVDLWDTVSNNRVLRINPRCASCSAAFSPDGRFVAVELQERRGAEQIVKRIVIVDTHGVDSPQWLRPYDVTACNGVGRVTWSEDSRFLLAGGTQQLSYGERFPSVVHVWNRRTGSHIADLVSGTSSLRVVGREIINGELWAVSLDQELVRWDLTDLVLDLER